MAEINSNDVKLTIIPEVTAGTTPTTGTRYELPVKTGLSLPVYKANEIQSETMRANRASNGSRRGNGSGELSFDFRFQKADAIEALMASAVSGTWADVLGVQTLVAGKTDSYFTTVAELASNMFQISAGATVDSMKISAKAAAGVDISFGGKFTTRTTSATNNPITTTAVGSNVEYVGSEVTEVTIGATVLQFTELNFEVSQDRTMKNVLGSSSAIGIGTAGNRKIKFTAKLYRQDFSLETLVTGAAQAVSFKIGTVGDGYKITIPAAYGMVPSDETGDQMLVNLEFTAGYDEVSGHDLVIEQL